MKAFPPCPVVDIPNDEFESWCKPWKGYVVVHVLRKRVRFKIIEFKIKKIGLM